MRRALIFKCEKSELAGTIDGGDNATGLLIVSGGNEIRIGAHRGMAKLATAVAMNGHPVFRFDRRGIGDSEGENTGFLSSGPDIAAAIAAFRRECPKLRRIVAFGNCDAATALVLHRSPVDALILANPWIVEPVDDLPPPAAIRDRYSRKIRDPEAWTALLTGKVDLRAMAKGLGRIALPKKAPGNLATRFAESAAGIGISMTIILAERDNTAIAFADAWKPRNDAKVERIDTASHSFSGETDFDSLFAIVLHALT